MGPVLRLQPALEVKHLAQQLVGVRAARARIEVLKVARPARPVAKQDLVRHLAHAPIAEKSLEIKDVLLQRYLVIGRRAPPADGQKMVPRQSATRPARQHRNPNRRE